VTSSQAHQLPGLSLRHHSLRRDIVGSCGAMSFPVGLFFNICPRQAHMLALSRQQTTEHGEHKGLGKGCCLAIGRRAASKLPLLILETVLKSSAINRSDDAHLTIVHSRQQYA
jgi:hypothetical protein